MKLIQKIDWFKIITIAILVAIIFILNNLSKNGRYKDVGEEWVMDTRTGYIFNIDNINENGTWYSKPKIPEKD